jgi:hypothetical protein
MWWPWKRKTFKPWAVFDQENHTWNKVVSTEKPVALFNHWTQGPFRSEIDAEEFCDRNNAARFNKVYLYNKVVFTEPKVEK